MWVVNAPNDPNIKMAEGDFGIILPIKVKGLNFSAADSIDIVIKSKFNGEDLIHKTYNNIENDTVPFELTEAESALLPIGQYVYRIDWYQNGNFMCNIIVQGTLKVVDKV